MKIQFHLLVVFSVIGPQKTKNRAVWHLHAYTKTTRETSKWFIPWRGSLASELKLCLYTLAMHMSSLDYNIFITKSTVSRLIIWQDYFHHPLRLLVKKKLYDDWTFQLLAFSLASCYKCDSLLVRMLTFYKD